jgi:hypothetical protein
MSALGGSEPQTKGTDEGVRAKASTEQNSGRGTGVFVCDIAKRLGIVGESWPIEDCTGYGAGKKAGEKQIKSIRLGLAGSYVCQAWIFSARAENGALVITVPVNYNTRTHSAYIIPNYPTSASTTPGQLHGLNHFIDGCLLMDANPTSRCPLIPQLWDLLGNRSPADQLSPRASSSDARNAHVYVRVEATSCPPGDEEVRGRQGDEPQLLVSDSQ